MTVSRAPHCVASLAWIAVADVVPDDPLVRVGRMRQHQPFSRVSRQVESAALVLEILNLVLKVALGLRSCQVRVATAAAATGAAVSMG